MEQSKAWLLTLEPSRISISGQGSLSWPGAWSGRAAQKLRFDLEVEVAEIPFVDGQGRPFDFHALRHLYITDLTAGGLQPMMAQQLARHSDINNLTRKHYTQLNLHDVAGAGEQLSDPTNVELEQNQATGTDDRPNLLRSRCATGVKTGVKLSSNGSLGKIGEALPETRKTPVITGVLTAEDKGLEPSTPYGAPDFESGC